MASILKVDTIQDQSGNNIINESADTITIGASGDTITIPSGATITNSGTGNYSVLPIEFSESESRFIIRVDASTLAANDDFRISLSYFSN